MTKTFGNRKQEETTFTVNDVPFTARLLSLQEESLLAGVSLDGLDSESPDEMRGTIEAMAGAVAQLLEARLQSDHVEIDADWVMENLTVSDLEGVVEYLRSGEVREEG